MANNASSTPQSRKLGIKSGDRICLDHSPHGWQLSDSPPDVTLVGSRGSVDLIISFFTSSDQIKRRLPSLVKRIYPAGALWIAWPRRSGGHVSDITDNIVREVALPIGIVDVKVAAIDDDWSGLRFVWRMSNRGLSQ
jgi:hypothetical protein